MFGFTSGLVVGLVGFLIAERYRRVTEALREADALRRKRLAQQVERPKTRITEQRESGAPTVRIRSVKFPKKVRRNF